MGSHDAPQMPPPGRPVRRRPRGRLRCCRASQAAPPPPGRSRRDWHLNSEGRTGLYSESDNLELRRWCEEHSENTAAAGIRVMRALRAFGSSARNAGRGPISRAGAARRPPGRSGRRGPRPPPRPVIARRTSEIRRRHGALPGIQQPRIVQLCRGTFRERGGGSACDFRAQCAHLVRVRGILAEAPGRAMLPSPGSAGAGPRILGLAGRGRRGRRLAGCTRLFILA